MYKGIEKNQNYTWLICAAQNMKNIVNKMYSASSASVRVSCDADVSPAALVVAAVVFAAVVPSVALPVVLLLCSQALSNKAKPIAITANSRVKCLVVGVLFILSLPLGSSMAKASEFACFASACFA